jgi:hypothetical protein
MEVTDFRREEMKTNKVLSIAGTMLVLAVFFSLLVSATITPATFSATKCPGESALDPLNVEVPMSVPKADVLFIFDLTGSMADELNSAKAGASAIMSSFPATDITFGVVSHMDYNGVYNYGGYFASYGSGPDYPYMLNQPLTGNKATVQAAINSLNLGYGDDSPESYWRVLYESYADPAIMWRDGAKRIVVEFGDDRPHDLTLGTGIDPGRDALAGTGDDLAMNPVLNGMATNNIELLFVSSGSYLTSWNTWAAMTGGHAYDLTGDFVALVVSAINEGLTNPNVENLHLVASAGYGPWLTASDPLSYSGVTGVTVPFKATITVPIGTAPGVYTFTLNAVDSHGVIYGSQEVTITVKPGLIIDIKPGCFPNCISPKYVFTPVAILGTCCVDVKKIDRNSLTFGPTGTEAKVVMTYFSDVNGDGKLDLCCYFYTMDTHFKIGDTQGILKGKMLDGKTFSGTDSVKVVPW